MRLADLNGISNGLSWAALPRRVLFLPVGPLGDAAGPLPQSASSAPRGFGRMSLRSLS